MHKDCICNVRKGWHSSLSDQLKHCACSKTMGASPPLTYVFEGGMRTSGKSGQKEGCEAGSA